MIAGWVARCGSTCAGASDDDATAASPPKQRQRFHGRRIAERPAGIEAPYRSAEG
jgi:hypothetical protein